MCMCVVLFVVSEIPESSRSLCFFLRNWQNRVYPGGFWTKSGTFFFATEDLLHNWQVADCEDCDAAAAALLTSRPTKIHCDWWTTCRPDETALRSMVAWPSVSEDSQPRSGARTKRQDHVETLHLLLRTFQRRALATTPEGAWRAGVASGIRVVVVAGAWRRKS